MIPVPLILIVSKALELEQIETIPHPSIFTQPMRFRFFSFFSCYKTIRELQVMFQHSDRERRSKFLIVVWVSCLGRTNAIIVLSSNSQPSKYNFFREVIAGFLDRIPAVKWLKDWQNLNDKIWIPESQGRNFLSLSDRFIDSWEVGLKSILLQLSWFRFE